MKHIHVILYDMVLSIKVAKNKKQTKTLIKVSHIRVVICLLFDMKVFGTCSIASQTGETESTPTDSI